jgi:hypothetical protein
VVEFDHFKIQARLQNIVLSIKVWIDKTIVIDVIINTGKYGGSIRFMHTYIHSTKNY